MYGDQYGEFVCGYCGCKGQDRFSPLNLCKIAFKTLRTLDVRLQTGRAVLAKAVNGSVREYTLCLSKFNNINQGVIGNEWVKSEEVQSGVMYIQFSLRHLKILSAHQSFFVFSNDNKLKYCLRRKQSYLFIHFDLLSLAIDGFVHLIFCKRVGRP